MGLDALALTIISMGLPCCLLALGVFLSFRILDFADMTAEGSVLIGGALCAALIYKGMPPVVATLLGMLAGGCCGFITGCLNRFLKIPKLLSGIITMTAAGSVALMIMGFAFGSPFASRVDIEASQTIFSFLDPAIFKGWQEVIVEGVIVILIMTLAYFFFGTEYGMAIRATGINERMAKSQGINTTAATIICITISNSLIGLTGALMAQVGNGFSSTSATGYLVVGLASILIGETLFGKRSFRNYLISICLGSLIYWTILDVLTFIFSVPADLEKVIYAILIVIALCLPMFKKEIKKRFTRKKEEA